jgi:hypothetical protein
MDLLRIRLNNYDIDATTGHIICSRPTRGGCGETLNPTHPDYPKPRLLRNLCAVIRIESRDSAMVDRLVAAIDEPAALCGRNRHGAVLLFRLADNDNPAMEIPGSRWSNVSTVTAGTTPLKITCGPDGIALVTLDAGAYTWGKNRSPADVVRENLPRYTADIGAAAFEAAHRLASATEAA